MSQLQQLRGSSKKSPAQANHFPLQHGHISAGVLVDHRLVANVLGPTRKLQRAQSLLSAHLAWADISDDHGFSISPKRVLHDMRALLQTDVCIQVTWVGNEYGVVITGERFLKSIGAWTCIGCGHGKVVLHQSKEQAVSADGCSKLWKVLCL